MSETTGEKPFEQLSETERKIFDLCGEVISYTNKVAEKQGILDAYDLFLRDEATKLYTAASSMDMASDDRYVRVLREYEELKSRFEFAKKRKEKGIVNYRFFENFDKPIEQIVNLIRGQQIKAGAEIRVGLVTDKNFTAYGDDQVGIEIKISDTDEQICKLFEYEEIFDYVRYDKLSVWVERVKEILAEKGIQFKFYSRLHDYGGQQLTIMVQDVKTEQALELLKKILDYIKNNPRKKKNTSAS